MTHEHHHEHDCACGHDHEQEHEHGCACGHDHEHSHQHGCACGHDHRAELPDYLRKAAAHIAVSGNEMAILQTIQGVSYLPCARFLATKADEDDVTIDCLSPVYLYDTSDTMEEAKSIGEVLTGLEDKGLLSLDYDRPLEGFDYTLYTESDLYAFFCQTIEEAKGKNGFLCDTALIELGSMAVTPLGEAVIECQG